MTDPDWLALADFLDAHANDMRAWTEDEPKFRATAEGLRHLAAITAERDRLREAIVKVLDDDSITMSGEGFRLLAVGLALAEAEGAASLSPTPTPDSCPTPETPEDYDARLGDGDRDDAWHDSGQP